MVTSACCTSATGNRPRAGDRAQPTYFDPSGFLDGTEVYRFFSKTNVWGVAVVVDHERPSFVPLQSLVDPPSGGSRYDGRCVTTVLLVLCCCLRFHCHDLQRMVDVLRCVLPDLADESDWETRSALLSQWQSTLIQHTVRGGYDPQLTRARLLESIGLRVPRGNDPDAPLPILSDGHCRALCGPKGTAQCTALPCTGYTLCRDHLPSFCQDDALADRPPPRPMEPWRPLPPPFMLPATDVGPVGHVLHVHARLDRERRAMPAVWHAHRPTDPSDDSWFVLRLGDVHTNDDLVFGFQVLREQLAAHVRALPRSPVLLQFLVQGNRHVVAFHLARWDVSAYPLLAIYWWHERLMVTAGVEGLLASSPAS